MTEAEAIALIMRALGGQATTAEIAVVIRALCRRYGEFPIDGRDIAKSMKASGLFELHRQDPLKSGLWALRASRAGDGGTT
jgi:hypothetical protein